MTDTKQPEELNDAELGGMAGGGGSYKVGNSEVQLSKAKVGKFIRKHGINAVITSAGGGSGSI